MTHRLAARVTLLEYGDFECPFCQAAHPVVEEVRRRLRDQLRFVYRHFPLANVHPHAEAAAEAAEAAGAQGRFWPMHDRIREDFMSGVRSGVNGTPTFYVNGVRHDGGVDLGSLLAALLEAREAA